MNVLILILVSAFSVYAADQKNYEIDLNSALNRMLKDNGEVNAEKKEMDLAEGRIDQVRAALYPKPEAYILSAPIFENKGNALYSKPDFSHWGIFAAVKLNIIQPIYTFGVADEYRKAATEGYEVSKQMVRSKESELVYRTKKFYYGLQLATDLFDLVKDGREKIEDAIKKAEEMLERDKIKREDVFRIKTVYAEILAKYDEADRGKFLAAEALKWTLSISHDSEIKLKEDSIKPEELEIKSEAEYLSNAISKRPEVNMLKSGIEAKEALWQAQAKQKRPVFFALGAMDLAYSNVRNYQSSAYAYNPYNTATGLVLFGLKFNLDWWSINAMSKQSKAEFEKLLTAQDAYMSGMMLEVRKAYRELTDYRRALDYTKEGKINATKWFYNVGLGYGMGLIEAKDLLLSLEALFKAEFNYYMAIFNYNMALAELTRVVGEEVVPSIRY